MFDHELREAAERVLLSCRKRGLTVTTVESCTGGLVAATLTAIAGSSDVVDRAWVTYSNGAKNEMVGVPRETIEAHGAVSEPVARAMAEGLLARAPVAITVAVTGIAGPGGGSAEKPVGLVWLAWAWRVADGSVQAEALRQVFPGDRAAVRAATVACALRGVLDRLDRLGAAPSPEAAAPAARPFSGPHAPGAER